MNNQRPTTIPTSSNTMHSPEASGAGAAASAEGSIANWATEASPGQRRSPENCFNNDTTGSVTGARADFIERGVEYEYRSAAAAAAGAAGEKVEEDEEFYIDSPDAFNSFRRAVNEIKAKRKNLKDIRIKMDLNFFYSLNPKGRETVHIKMLTMQDKGATIVVQYGDLKERTYVPQWATEVIAGDIYPSGSLRFTGTNLKKLATGNVGGGLYLVEQKKLEELEVQNIYQDNRMELPAMLFKFTVNEACSGLDLRHMHLLRELKINRISKDVTVIAPNSNLKISIFMLLGVLDLSATRIVAQNSSNSLTVKYRGAKALLYFGERKEDALVGGLRPEWGIASSLRKRLLGDLGSDDYKKITADREANRDAAVAAQTVAIAELLDGLTKYPLISDNASWEDFKGYLFVKGKQCPKLMIEIDANFINKLQRTDSRAFTSLENIMKKRKDGGSEIMVEYNDITFEETTTPEWASIVKFRTIAEGATVTVKGPVKVITMDKRILGTLEVEDGSQLTPGTLELLRGSTQLNGHLEIEENAGAGAGAAGAAAAAAGY